MVLLLPVLGVKLAAADPPPNTELVSQNPSGLGGNDNSGDLVTDLSVSSDGRYVAFDSSASDLVPGDSNNNLDVFVRDRVNGTTTLADVSTSGTQGSSYALAPDITPDGRYVAFVTGSALVPSDTNGQPDVYVRDLVTGTTTKVSSAPDGSQLSQGVTNDAPQISADGRYVTYASYSPELSGQSNQSQRALAVTDRDSDGNGVFDEPGGTSTTVLVPDGALGSMSHNGRYIGYSTNVDNQFQTFLIDRGSDADGNYDQPPTTTLISADTDGNPANGNSGPGYVSNFGDVAFWSAAPDIGGGSNPSVLVRDRSGTITTISNSISNQPSISDDGQLVAFDTDTGTDGAYVFDRARDTATPISVDSNGDVQSGSIPHLSTTGAYVAFSSSSTELAPSGSPQHQNVYLYTRDVTPPAITITAPSDGASYAVGQVVDANYACSDPSGVQSCSGPVPSGAAIDTSSPGSHTFTVTATDNVGNTGSSSVTYSVGTAVSVGNAQIPEGNSGSSSLVFPVSLDRASSLAVKVGYATSDGTATAGTDYTAKTGTLTIPAGSTSGSITVAVKGDTQVEPDETLTLTLSPPTPSATTYLQNATATGTIVNDDYTSNIQIGDASAPEGNSGTTVMSFPVSLDAPAEAAIKVGYTTSDGTATAGSDYRAKSGTLTIPAGASAATIGVTIIGDVSPEADETFHVVLTGVTAGNGLITRGTATGTIQNDDTAASVSIGNVSANEGNRSTTPFTFQVSLDRPAAATIKVTYTTANGTATAPSDYIAKSGTITFLTGASTATITVKVVGDTVVEPDETFSVVLTGVTSGPAVISASNGTGTGTIINDD
jgi:hypothetical protein